MTLRLTRRDALCCGAIGLGATAGGLLCAPAVAAQQEAAKPGSSFTFCLNTGTIRGFKLSLVEEIDLTHVAMHFAVEQSGWERLPADCFARQRLPHSRRRPSPSPLSPSA